MYTSPRVYELALPWQTSSTTPDIQRAAGWRHEFSTWLSRQTIVSPVVNAREETAGVPLFLFLFFSLSLSRRSGRHAARHIQHDSLSIKERNILAIVFTNWGYVGDGYRRRRTIRVKYVSWSDAYNYRACARVCTHVGMIALLHGAGAQMDPCG